MCCGNSISQIQNYVITELIPAPYGSNNFVIGGRRQSARCEKCFRNTAVFITVMIYGLHVHLTDMYVITFSGGNSPVKCVPLSLEEWMTRSKGYGKKSWRFRKKWRGQILEKLERKPDECWRNCTGHLSDGMFKRIHVLYTWSAPISFLSVRPSVSKTPTIRISVKFGFWELIRNFVEKLKIWLISDQNIRYFP